MNHLKHKFYVLHSVMQPWKLWSHHLIFVVSVVRHAWACPECLEITNYQFLQLGLRYCRDPKKFFRWDTYLHMSLFLSAHQFVSVHLSHLIFQEPYIIWSKYLVHLCKMMISPSVFFILQKFWFFGLLGR